jgi:hypothetical protein
LLKKNVIQSCKGQGLDFDCTTWMMNDFESSIYTEYFVTGFAFNPKRKPKHGPGGARTSDLRLIRPTL